MSAKLKLRRNPYGITTLELQGQDYDLELKLLSRRGKRERRAFVLGFLRHIKPWIRHLQGGAIDHPNCAIIRSCRAWQRGIPSDPGRPLDDHRAKLGYEIRMKRLRLGLTQRDLAARLEISRQHLSEMERGRFTPRASTWLAISMFLDENGPNFEEPPST